ncbi:MAG: hypothetical protein ACLGIN_00675 [Candidatus Sericytochromatia bacterium]
MMISTIGPAASASPHPATRKGVGGDFEQELRKTAETQQPAEAKPAGGLLGTAKLGPITMTDMKAARDEALAFVKSRLTTRLSEAGVDTRQPFELGIGYDGQVYVRGDHPDKARIEAIFKEDPVLRNELAKTFSLSAIMKAGEEAIAFQKAYAENPEAAVARFAHLFNQTMQDVFFLTVEAGAKFSLSHEQRFKA